MLALARRAGGADLGGGHCPAARFRAASASPRSSSDRIARFRLGFPPGPAVRAAYSSSSFTRVHGSPLTVTMRSISSGLTMGLNVVASGRNASKTIRITLT
jgi:hypothetical protein